MFTTFTEAAEYIKKHSVRMVDLKFTDLWGRWHHVTLSSTQFQPRLMQDGVGFDGSSVGLKSVKSGDMSLIPDLSTGFMDPFCEVPTISFLCNTLEADTKVPFHKDPRQIAKNAEAALIKSSIADSSRWGPEFEFYVLDSVSFENNMNTASYHLNAEEISPNDRWAETSGYSVRAHGGYHAIPPTDKLFNLRALMCVALEDAGVPVKYHHHEVGSAGQCEIETPLLGFLKAADAAMMIKYFTKNVAVENGKTVTFLPKPFFGESGSGMHFHQQLFRGDKNLFYDPKTGNLLSQTALYYIGGLLKHAPAVLAFTNPSTNSYRRLVPGFEAPVNSFFSTGNRSAAIRVPKYATQPDKVRFEFRPPDATCNPYLAISAQLLAGIDGIRNRIDPTVEGFGPFDEDIFAWSPERRATIKSLPVSLDAALAALAEDHEFLRYEDVFSDELITDWIKTKKAEIEEIRLRPHPFEVEKYFDI
ncbi:MAG: type I glutamate--ammonia ligase [Anaerolineaceae bacterium]